MNYWGSITRAPKATSTSQPGQGSGPGPGPGGVVWPPFTLASEGGKAGAGAGSVLRMDLGERMAVHENYKADDCYFWQTH